MKVARRLRDSLAGTSFLPTRMVLNTEGESIDFSALNVKDQEVPTLFPVPVMLDMAGRCVMPHSATRESNGSRSRKGHQRICSLLELHASPEGA